MARHVIPDSVDEDALELVWDDEAGTVEGDNSFAEGIRWELAQPLPLNLSRDGRILFLRDPAHDPRDLWHLLPYACWKEPLRSRMPAILRDVEPTPAKPAPLPRIVVDGVERDAIPGMEFVW